MVPRGLIVGLAILSIAGAFASPARAQDYSTTIESHSEPLENRVETRIVEEDLTPRGYYLEVPYRARVLDNHAEVVARREASSAERFAASVEAREAIFTLYDRLSR